MKGHPHLAGKSTDIDDNVLQAQGGSVLIFGIAEHKSPQHLIAAIQHYHLETRICGAKTGALQFKYHSDRVTLLSLKMLVNDLR